MVFFLGWRIAEIVARRRFFPRMPVHLTVRNSECGVQFRQVQAILNVVFSFVRFGQFFSFVSKEAEQGRDGAEEGVVASSPSI